MTNTMVSYVLGHFNNNSLVLKTLDQATDALTDTKPMIHSDRGFQYTPNAFKTKIDQSEMIQSMSRLGKVLITDQ